MSILYTKVNGQWVGIETIKGDTGEQGIPGEPGQDGQDGEPGEPGADGQPGKSAYQSAVDGGYEGTEAEFNADLAALPETEETLVGHVNNTDIHVTAEKKAEWDAKYTKPSTGIPASDIASGVIPSIAGLASETYVDNAVSAEATARGSADAALQGQIDALTSKSDVVDVVATYAALQAYDTSTLLVNDVVKVLSDSTHSDARSYYRWTGTAWTYIGSEAVGYTKAETDTLLNAKQNSLTDAQLAAANSGITSAKRQGYDSHVADNDIHVTAAQKQTWNGKQDAISDLAAIRSGAAAGATALQSVPSTYRTASEQDVIDSGKLSTTGDGSNVTAAFTQASTRTNIATGEKLSVLFGKVAKWFADLKTVAFSGSYNDLTNKPTIPTVPTNVSAFTNDAGYLTSHQSLADYRTASAQDTIDNNQNTAINSKEAKGKITISGVEKTANTHTVTIVTDGVTTNLTLVGVS